MKKLFSFLVTLQLLFSASAMAQEDDLIKNTQNDILIVAGSGVAGGILGLSTLSFVDKPSKHIANIWTGAALGVIAGVIFVAYNSAQKNSEDLASEVSHADFETSDRSLWHLENDSFLTSQSVQFGTQIWQSSF